MLISNGVANLVGIIVVTYLMSGQRHELSGELFRATLRLDLIFISLSYALAILLTLLYETPIRRFVNLKILDGPLPEGLEAKARTRRLNEPFYLIALDMAIWLSAATLYPLVFWIIDAGGYVMLRSFFTSFHTGLITTTAGVFCFRVCPTEAGLSFLFSRGRIYCRAGIFRIDIRARLIAMLFACNLIPFFSILTYLWQATQSGRRQRSSCRS